MIAKGQTPVAVLGEELFPTIVTTLAVPDLKCTLKLSTLFSSCTNVEHNICLLIFILKNERFSIVFSNFHHLRCKQFSEVITSNCCMMVTVVKG